MNKQYVDARRNLRRIIETNPFYASAYERLGYSYYCEGNYEKAIEYYEKSDSLTGQLSSKIEIVIALAHSGQKDKAKKFFNKLINQDELNEQGMFSIGMSPGGGSAVAMAMACFSLSESDEAFRWLEKAYDKREPLLIGLKIDPIYDPFRGDPRFIRIYKKMNFPE
jgi:tetratricopeptide (TPR) repeat protein